jgi:hypothetical protein
MSRGWSTLSVLKKHVTLSEGIDQYVMACSDEFNIEDSGTDGYDSTNVTLWIILLKQKTHHRHPKSLPFYSQDALDHLFRRQQVNKTSN